MPSNNTEVEKRLWEAADELRANSQLSASEYAIPVEGLIFLRQADYAFQQVTDEIQAERAAAVGPRGPGQIKKDHYHDRGVAYLPDYARFEYLLNLPEGKDIGRHIDTAMRGIEGANRKTLADALPKGYSRLDNATLSSLLRIFNTIDVDGDGDVFGRIYEYFLGKFAMSEGSLAGEFYTPSSVVKLIVEIIEPYHGRILDPACGSGGMFVQSGDFVERHRRQPGREISIFAQERIMQTVRRCKRNLAVHRLEGEIRQANSYYEDVHQSVGRFDYVMANPPFNVDKIDKDRIKDDRAHYPFGMPTVDNGNFIWIQLFYSALNKTGRAGFVMSNGASDARGSELEIRKKLIQTGAVDVIVTLASNFFYTVTLPVTLWFLDRGKAGTDRHDRVLFLDARHIYTQIDRAHREFTPAQIEFLANIVRLYRGQEPETEQGSADLMAERFPEGQYQDIPGLCNVVTLDQIQARGWSLNPGRYVGVADRDDYDYDFAERLQQLHEELEILNAEAHELEEQITGNIARILELAS